MNTAFQTVFRHTFLNNALTRLTRFRQHDARCRNADDDQRGATEFVDVTECANHIGFGVNGPLVISVAAAARPDEIIGSREHLAPAEKICNMVRVCNGVGHRFGRHIDVS